MEIQHFWEVFEKWGKQHQQITHTSNRIQSKKSASTPKFNLPFRSCHLHFIDITYLFELTLNATGGSITTQNSIYKQPYDDSIEILHLPGCCQQSSRTSAANQTDSKWQNRHTSHPRSRTRNNETQVHFQHTYILIYRMCIVIANFIISVEINKQFETERKERAFYECWQSGNAVVSTSTSRFECWRHCAGLQ